MSLALTAAIAPLAGVFLLSGTDVFMMKVFHQVIHIAQIASSTSFPPTDRYLLIALSTVVILLA
jgi:hypothetical protein